MTREEDCCRGSRKGSPGTCASECVWARAAISGTPPALGLSRAEREKQDDEAEISRLARRVEALTVELNAMRRDVRARLVVAAESVVGQVDEALDFSGRLPKMEKALVVRNAVDAALKADRNDT